VLRDSFVRRTTTLVAARASPGGGATKLLLRLQDGLEVESVIMEYDTTADGGARGGLRRTLCVSSQAGCAMGCTFCATGTMGELGSLFACEILEQADWAAAAVADAARAATALTPATPPPPSRRPSAFAIRNVVFMGMGEPLNNYDAVVAAVRGLTDSRRFGLRRSAVTVSTVGVVPRLRTLAADMPGVSLALSLHAPDQETRLRIVPSAKAYPLPRLMDAVARYQASSGRRVFVEYVLLAGVNDAVAQADAPALPLWGADALAQPVGEGDMVAPIVGEAREEGEPASAVCDKDGEALCDAEGVLDESGVAVPVPVAAAEAEAPADVEQQADDVGEGGCEPLPQ
jgi:adenine C2-methylase RlmN of 23S rRNA A2503 and tRNA A37